MCAYVISVCICDCNIKIIGQWIAAVHRLYVKVALSDLDVAVYDADILVFVVPYQYIHEVCEKLRGKIKSTALAVSLVKVSLDVIVFLLITLMFCSFYGSFAPIAFCVFFCVKKRWASESINQSASKQNFERPPTRHRCVA